MTTVRVLPEAFRSIFQHAERTYPDECCGFLLTSSGSTSSPGERVVHRVAEASNRVGDERRRRFLILPEELRELERTLEGTEESLVGFYHSHPDHPARPSLFDQEHAWPWYTYLVLAVESGRADTLGAFELDDETREFHEVSLIVPTDHPVSAMKLR